MKADKTKREKEFVKLADKYVGRNYLKYLHLALEDVYYNVDGMSRERMTVLLFISDYEFFTIDHLSKALRMSQANTKKHKLQPLMRCGMVEPIYHRKNFEGSVSEISYEELKRRHGYRTRYAITKKGRDLIKKFYDKIEGLETITVPGPEYFKEKYSQSSSL